MAVIFVSVGSNIEPEHYLRRSFGELRSLFENLIASPVYQTIPVGTKTPQNDYLNAVYQAETVLEVEEVWKTLKDIEIRLGRSRTADRYAPRTIDLDLLLYDRETLWNGSKKVPHEQILSEGFVLNPLCDLAPLLTHPETGQKLTEHLKMLPEKGIRRINFLWEEDL